ncbi:hypothetical protein [Streptomyces sp. NRRL F-4489]|uniref:hypothetical protein n=1 Tax=Streptomyces sp. NRRL F-4489 TaxID=1609095 RepID=UPI000AC32D24|nr:hypothetical protein [Streptomyces sp. NRRL F-4489]
MAALGCVVLAGCGARSANTDETPAAGAVSATARPGGPPSDNGPEGRFLSLMTRVGQGCAPQAPNGNGGGGGPEPDELPGGSASPAPKYGPGETPPGTPDAAGKIPVPVDDPAPSKPASDSTGPKPPAKEVPLTGTEKCSGKAHAERVSKAFENTKAISYQAMRKTLSDLGYPASRIHQMPNHAGAPRARIDLRMMGGHLALEVTGTSSGVITEAFGAPETEDVKVADVKRKPKLDAPTS